MRNTIFTALLLIAMGLAVTIGFTKRGGELQVTNSQINIKDISEHGLTIIGPADPSYEGMVKTWLRGKQNSVINGLQPYSIFIKNTGSKTVVAFTLKWELMTATGSIRTQLRDYITLWKLMGITAPDNSGYIIEPNATIFVSPSNIEPLKINAGKLREANLTPDETADLNEIKAELAQYINFTVTLDGAFFDDGTFVGLDNTGFFAKVEAKRNAKRDLILELKQELQRGASKRQAFKHIEQLANGPESELDSKSKPADHYGKYKKDAAATFLQMRKSVGDDRASELILEQIQEPVPELRKF